MSTTWHQGPAWLAAVACLHVHVRTFVSRHGSTFGLLLGWAWFHLTTSMQLLRIMREVLMHALSLRNSNGWRCERHMLPEHAAAPSCTHYALCAAGRLRMARTPCRRIMRASYPRQRLLHHPVLYAHLSLMPSLPVLDTRSQPARSTKCSTELLGPFCLLHPAWLSRICATAAALSAADASMTVRAPPPCSQHAACLVTSRALTTLLAGDRPIVRCQLIACWQTRQVECCTL